MKNIIFIWFAVGGVFFALMIAGYLIFGRNNERNPNANVAPLSEPNPKNPAALQVPPIQPKGLTTHEDFVKQYGEISKYEWGQLKHIESDMGRVVLTPELWKLRPAELKWINWMFLIIEHEMGTQQNQPVRFYGKVVSEDGKGLAGVSVTGFVSYVEPTVEKLLEKLEDWQARRKHFTLVTDANGEFQVIEDIGRSLYLRSMQKEGYVDVPGPRYVYNFFPNAPEDPKFRGNKENPAVFKMKTVSK